jgi:DNA polymerase-4
VLLRHPELRGKPLIVAGSGPRAVVTTASYEARKFGIDSAMPAARAKALCPHAVVIAPDMAAYKAASAAVWALVRARFDRVQQAGVDEAYIDLAAVDKPLAELRAMVAEVQAETGLFVSVGVGPNRLVAKTVSGACKPKGFAVLSREAACEQFADSPTRVIQGIGPKSQERLAELGIATVGQLQRCDPQLLSDVFGERWGPHLQARAHFHDDSPVELSREVKSQSRETTFPRDVADPDELAATLDRLAEQLCSDLERRELAGRTIAIKVRLDDWTTVTRARTLPQRTRAPEQVVAIARELFAEYAPVRPIRLLGVRVAGFNAPASPAPQVPSHQLALPF